MRSAFHLHVLYSRIEGVTLRKECKIVIFRLVLPVWQYHWPQYLDVTKLAKAKLKCFLNCSMFVSNYKIQEVFIFANVLWVAFLIPSGSLSLVN
jgi:hypothetical protein